MSDFSESKQRVFEASLRLFASKGYDATSMSDIADAVGIRKSSLYSHFKNKETLFDTILTRIIAQQHEQTTSILYAIRNETPLKQLELYFINFIQSCRNNTEVDFWIRFYYFPPASLAASILRKTQTAEDAGREKLHRIIQNGIANGSIRDMPADDVLITYYQLLMGFLVSLNDYQKMDPAPDMHRCLGIFFAGIRGT